MEQIENLYRLTNYKVKKSTSLFKQLTPEIGELFIFSEGQFSWISGIVNKNVYLLITSFKTKSTLNKLLHIISEETDINISTLKSCSRKRHIVEARYIYFFLARKLTDFSLSDISSLLNKNHSTVLYGIKTVNDISEIKQQALLIYNKYFNYE